MKRLAKLWLLAGLLSVAMSAGGQTRPVVVLYPDVPEPERAVFRLLREGITARASRSGATVAAVELNANDSAEGIEARLRSQSPRSVVVLGRRAFELTQQISWPAPRLVAGVELPTGSRGVNGISLTPDPRIVLGTLREIAPNMKRIFIVLDPERSSWLQAPAEDAAQALGFQLRIAEARTVGEAAARYLEIFRRGDPRTDAVWLLENGKFVNADTLPTLMEESWSRHFVLFSNVVEHVRQGALFAHYPDPVPLGERLAQRALAPATSEDGMTFLQDTRRASNVRVARHLGRMVNANGLSRFDLVFGQP